MSTITDQITNMQNATEQYKATTAVKSNEITGDSFLLLMTKQLENQDPTQPVDNSQMLAQEAQFTTLSKTEEMSNNIASNNGITQALSMVGSVVQLKDPDNDKNIITGVVQYAKLNGKNSSVVVNGKEYPVSNVTNVTTLSNIDLFNKASQAANGSGTSTPDASKSGTQDSSSSSSSSSTPAK